MIAIIHVIESNYIPILKYKGLICLSNPKLDLYVDPNEMSNIKQKVNLKKEYLNYKNLDLNKSILEISRIIDNKISIFEISEILNLPYNLVKMICDNFFYKNIIKKKEVLFNIMYLFIQGMYRSGTTTFSKILSNHPELVVKNDTLFPLFKNIKSKVEFNLSENKSVYISDYFLKNQNIFDAIQKFNLKENIFKKKKN